MIIGNEASTDNSKLLYRCQMNTKQSYELKYCTKKPSKITKCAPILQEVTNCHITLLYCSPVKRLG